MTNFEKYMNTIVSIRNQDSTDVAVAMDIRTGALKRCSEVGCEYCKFNWRYSANRHCEANLVNWLFEKYQEPVPKLTNTERGYCEIVQRGYIARSENDVIKHYLSVPEKDRGFWLTYDNNYSMPLDRNSFLFIKWDDEKPWSIEDLLKLEVEE